MCAVYSQAQVLRFPATPRSQLIGPVVRLESDSPLPDRRNGGPLKVPEVRIMERRRELDAPTPAT